MFRFASPFLLLVLILLPVALYFRRRYQVHPAMAASDLLSLREMGSTFALRLYQLIPALKMAALVLIVLAPTVVTFLVWYFDARNMGKALSQYKADVETVREMYASNARLVRSYEKLCGDLSTLSGDLKDIVILNTQNMTQLADSIHANQYCPAQRVEKKKVEVAQ